MKKRCFTEIGTLIIAMAISMYAIQRVDWKASVIAGIITYLIMVWARKVVRIVLEL